MIPAIVALLTVSATVNAQIRFDRPVVPPSFGASSSITVGDFDGNGREDVVVASMPVPRLRVYYSNAIGDHTKKNLEAAERWSGFITTMVGDFNKDGKDDLAFLQRDRVELTVCISTGRDFNVTKVPVSSNGPWKGNVLDFDHDGNLDIIIAANGKKIQFYKGNGSGSFTVSSIPVIPSYESYAFDFHVADLNDDNQFDFVVVSENVETYIKDPGEGYTTTTVDVEGELYQSNYEPRSSTIADFNNDGLPDLTVISLVNGSSEDQRLSFFSNNGNGFANAVQLPTPNGWTVGIDHADFDNDNREDLLLSHRGNENNVTVYRNIGNAHFEDKSPISPFFVGAQDIRFIDLDGEGSPEIINLAGNQTLQWYKWDGNKWDMIDSKIIEAACTVGGVFDMDNDGIKDIVGAAVSAPAIEIWYGKGDLTYEEPIFIPVTGTLWSATAADLNNDGYGDIVYNAGPTGNSNSPEEDGTAVLLSTGPRSYNPKISIGAYYTQTLFIITRDLDNDGDTDIFDRVTVFLNNGSGEFTPTDVPGGIGWDLAATEAGYFNSDNFLDLAVSTESGLYIYLNDGAGHFPSFMKNESIAEMDNIATADINNDGRWEIIGVSNQLDQSNLTYTHHLYVLTPSPNVTFSEMHHITPEPLSAWMQDVGVADLDGDGFTDIVACYASSQYGFAVYRGLPGGEFGDPVTYSEQPYGLYLQSPYALYLEDMDKDDRTDVVMFYLYEITVAVHRNISVVEPTKPSTNLQVQVNGTQAIVTLDKGNGNGRIMLVREEPGDNAIPLDNNFYRPSLVFGNGDKIGDSWTVLSDDKETATITGLATEKNYVVTVFEYYSNDTDKINYMTTGPSKSFSTFKSQAITFENTTDLVFGNEDITVTAVASSGLPVQVTVTIGEGIVDGASFTASEAGMIKLHAVQAGNSEYMAVESDVSFCVKPSKPGISVSDDGLITLTSSSDDNNHWYLGETAIDHATSNTYMPTIDGIYKVIVDVDGCNNSSDEISIVVGPTIASSDIEIIASSTTATVSLKKGNGNGRLIVIREENGDAGTPANGIFYVPNQTFRVGDLIGDGSVVMRDEQETITISGLSENSNYVVTVYEYFTNSINIINYSSQGTSKLFSTLKPQVITFNNTANPVFGSESLVITASSSSGLEVELTIVSGSGTIDGANFTPTQPGKVTLRGSQEGNSEYGAVEAETTFCVYPPKPAISISDDAIPQLSSSSDENNTWYLNDEVIDGATEKTYLPVSEGFYKVEVNVDGCSSFSDAAHLVLTGLGDVAGGDFSLSPNPATTIVRIELPEGFTSTTQPVFSTTTGRQFQLPYRTVEHGLEFNITDLNPGMYIISLSNQSLKLIKQ